MATRGKRIAVIGASGALGTEVLAALDRSPIRVAEIVPFASDRSLGGDVEFQEELYPIRSDPPRLHGLDFAFLCAPPGVSLDAARASLEAQVPALDCSGALALADDVPVCLAALGGAADGPLCALPVGPALALSLVLRPLAAAAGLRRVVGTVLESASSRGVRGIEALQGEAIALFNQDELPDPEVFERPVAFDCAPADERAEETARRLARVLGPGPRLALAAVQTPVFVGQGASLVVETERPLAPGEAEALLAKTPRVAVVGAGGGPTIRAAVGREEVLVGPVREAPALEHGLRLWLASDALALAAAEAVALASARLAAP